MSYSLLVIIFKTLRIYFQNIEDKVTELEQEVTIGNDD